MNSNNKILPSNYFSDYCKTPPENNNNLNPDEYPIRDPPEIKIHPSDHISYNSIKDSQRNSNQQLREEFIIPKIHVSPFNTSTINPDFNRKKL